MNRALKTLLIWLLMAVLPLNAVAAAMGMSCSAVHDRMANAQRVHAAEHQGAHAAMTAQKDHSVQHDGGHKLPSQAADDVDDDSRPAPSTCSGCSAYCVGAAAPPPPPVAPASSASGSEVVLVSPKPLVAGFIPDGQKRPPRRLTA